MDNTGPGRNPWQSWGQGRRGTTGTITRPSFPLAHLHLSPNTRYPVSWGSPVTGHRDPDIIPSNPLKLQMRKPKSRAVREVPVSQGRSFDYFAPSLSLPQHYFSPLATCSALKLQQIQGTVKVHHWWGFLKAPHVVPGVCLPREPL